MFKLKPSHCQCYKHHVGKQTATSQVADRECRVLTWHEGPADHVQSFK